MKYQTGVVLLFALTFSATAKAEASEMPNALQQDESSARWLPLVRRDDCLLAGPSAPPPLGFAVTLTPQPCLVPRYLPASAPNRASAPVPISMPPQEKTEPESRPSPDMSGLTTVLSSNGGLLRNDLSLPMINLVSMTVLPRSFKKHVSLERDWRTSQGLLRLHANIGRVHPFVEGSFLIIDGRVVSAFLRDPSPQESFREDRRMAELLALGAVRSPYWFAGATVDLGRGFALGAGGTVLFIDDRPFYAGALILTVPFGPKR